MKAIFLYNHNDHKILKKLKYINQAFISYFDEYIAYCINSLDELEIKIKEEVIKYDVLIFSGGDGTFNNVINNLIKYNIDIKIGYLPSGTANDIAHNLRIPRNIKKAVNIIKSNHLKSQNVYLFNDKYFAYVGGIGKFTSVSYKSKINSKRIFGTFAYVFRGMKELFKRYKIEGNMKIDDKDITIDTSLLLILNSKYIGGKKVNKYGFRNDGSFDIIVIKNKIWPLFNIACFVIFGKGKKNNNIFFESFQGRTIELSINDNDWCLDGENIISNEVKIQASDKYINIYTKEE